MACFGSSDLFHQPFQAATHLKFNEFAPEKVTKSPKGKDSLPTSNHHFSEAFAVTLPETNIAPKNGWLEYDRFLLGRLIFRGVCR